MNLIHSKDFNFEVKELGESEYSIKGLPEDIMQLIGYMASMGSNTLYSVKVIE